MKDIFNLEQDIMTCWSVCDDLKMLLQSGGYDNDDIQAVIRLYQKKFEMLWSTFEDVADEYHRRGRLEQMKDSASMRR